MLQRQRTTRVGETSWRPDVVVAGLQAMWGSNPVSGVFQWVVTHLIHRAAVFWTLQLLPVEFVEEGYTLRKYIWRVLLCVIRGTSYLTQIPRWCWT